MRLMKCNRDSAEAAAAVVIVVVVVVVVVDASFDAAAPVGSPMAASLGVERSG
jgi:hypothetical protein